MDADYARKPCSKMPRHAAMKRGRSQKDATAKAPMKKSRRAAAGRSQKKDGLKVAMAMKKCVVQKSRRSQKGGPKSASAIVSDSDKKDGPNVAMKKSRSGKPNWQSFNQLRREKKIQAKPRDAETQTPNWVRDIHVWPEEYEEDISCSFLRDLGTGGGDFKFTCRKLDFVDQLTSQVRCHANT